MTLYVTSTTSISQPTLESSGIGDLITANATLTSSFGQTVRQFELFSNFAITSAVEVGATADLNSAMNFVFGVVFSGDIVEPQNFTSSFGIAADPERIRNAEASFIRSPLSARFELTTSSVQNIYGYAVTLEPEFAINARPFTNFVDATVAATGVFGSFVYANLAQPFTASAAIVSDLSCDALFVDGTTRKFTEAQLEVINDNRAMVVDFVEIYPAFADPDLPYWDDESDVGDANDYQWPLNVVYRWNSSGRDLAVDTYDGASRFYKGKNVMMTLPAVEFNNLFNKKTTKISINGLLGFFQSAAHLGYFDGATVVFGKIVYDTANTTAGVDAWASGERISMDYRQVGRAVLLVRGLVNNIIFAGDGSTQSIQLEVSHGLYDFDQQRSLQVNTGSYKNYLNRTGFEDPTVGSSRMGIDILQNVNWGLTKA